MYLKCLDPFNKNVIQIIYIYNYNDLKSLHNLIIGRTEEICSSIDLKVR